MYAGAAATCWRGINVWYHGYTYQDRQAVTEYRWRRDSGWVSELDESAAETHVRYRLRAETQPGVENVLVLPAGLACIEASAFEGNRAIEKVLLPSGLVRVGERAFADCPQLEAVYMPDSVTDIAPDAFAGSDRAVLLCQSNNTAAAFARERSVPYLTDED